MATKQMNRTWANESRPYVLERANGRCEICGSFAPHILESHHIKPHSRDGAGSLANLIALCPNCHAVIEKLRSSMIDNPHFHDWIRGQYGEAGYEKFGELLQYRSPGRLGK